MDKSTLFWFYQTKNIILDRYLYLLKMSHAEISDVLNFIYDGEVEFVSEARFNNFVAVAKKFGLKVEDDGQTLPPTTTPGPAATQALVPSASGGGATG